MELILPGALWPNPSATAFAPSETHPRLARWLGQSRITAQPQSYQEILAQRLGLPPEPAARLRWLGEHHPETGDETPAGAILCADPIHLYLAREQLVVTELGAAHPSADEAAALTAALTEAVRSLWPMARFVAAVPTRWYLCGIPPEAVAAVAFTPLAEASGRPWRDALPQGPAARQWLRQINEWQVVLANHPVNRAREARGLPAINAVWVWGEAPLASTTPRPTPQRQTIVIAPESDPLLVGWLRTVGCPFQTEVPLRPRLPGTVVVLDALAEPARRLDLAAWQAQLANLERHWFAKLPTPKAIWLAAYRASFVAHPRWWRVWSPSRSLETLIFQP